MTGRSLASNVLPSRENAFALRFATVAVGYVERSRGRFGKPDPDAGAQRKATSYVACAARRAVFVELALSSASVIIERTVSRSCGKLRSLIRGRSIPQIGMTAEEKHRGAASSCHEIACVAQMAPGSSGRALISPSLAARNAHGSGESGPSAATPRSRSRPVPLRVEEGPACTSRRLFVDCGERVSCIPLRRAPLAVERIVARGR